jgi:glutathione S-transferase
VDDKPSGAAGRLPTVPTLTMHGVPPSHPCMTVAAALDYKGLEYERVDFAPGEHVERMQEIYGDGHSTVPGLLVDGEPVHGSRAILARLEQIQPAPTLYPSDAVREAERWGDEQLQDLGRRLPWGSLHFRPEAMGTFAGGPPLDGPGTDFAIKYVRASWRYHGISASRLHDDLAGLPAKIQHIQLLAERAVIGGEQPNAADLQIGATVRVLLPIADLRPLLKDSAAESVALRHFPDYPGEVPAGAFPAGWTPTSA